MLSKPLSIKQSGLACQWLGTIGMLMFAKCDQHIPCGSSVMGIFSSCEWMDGQIHIVIIVQTLKSCNKNRSVQVR